MTLRRYIDIVDSAGYRAEILTDCEESGRYGTPLRQGDRVMELLESPQLIKPIDWNLTDRQTNLVRAADFRIHPVEVVRDFPTARLLVQPGNVGGQIGLVSKTTGLLEYYVHYQTTNHPILGRCASQVKLWRSRYATVAGLAAMGLEQILLARFDTVVSDVAQTDRGREFWEVQISHYASSKTVGLLVGDTVHLYEPPEPIADWLPRQDGWGKERRYRQRRFFISNLDRRLISKG